MDEQTSTEQKQQILVVDDSEDMRVLLGWVLEKAGYCVIFAADGQASLTQAKFHRPDLILMDLSLPDINGWEAVAHLRKMPSFKLPPLSLSLHMFLPLKQSMRWLLDVQLILASHSIPESCSRN